MTYLTEVRDSARQVRLLAPASTGDGPNRLHLAMPQAVVGIVYIQGGVGMRGDELEFVTGLQLDGWVREPRRAVFF